MRSDEFSQAVELNLLDNLDNYAKPVLNNFLKFLHLPDGSIFERAASDELVKRAVSLSGIGWPRGT